MKIKLKRLVTKNKNQPIYAVCGSESARMSDAGGADNMNEDDDDTDMSQCNVSTRNRFTPLATNNQHPSDQPNSVYKINKPAPIVVPMSQISKMANELIPMAGKYTVKRISDGSVKLFPDDEVAQTQIKAIFTTKKVQHFSFLENDERLHKYVLYGLNKVEPAELIAEIKRATGDKLTPSIIKEMRINNPKYDDHHNYLVYFVKNPTLPVLQKYSQLWYTIVRWDHYRNKFKGPSRCTICQNFGHGAIKCGMEPKCVACAGNHLSSACPLLLEKRRLNKTQLDTTLLKCCHCGANHTASFLDCPKRLAYIEKRQAENRKYRGNRPQPNKSTNIMSNYNDNFPLYQPRNRPVLGDQIGARPFINNYYARNNSTPAQTQHTNPSNNDLFTLEQLNNICAEMLSKLRDCNTKEDQFLLMFNLATKYVYAR